MKNLKSCFLYVTGSVGRFKNRGRNHSERSRTPGRQTPRHTSPTDGRWSYDDGSDSSYSDNSRQMRHGSHSADHEHSVSTADRTLVDTLASEATLKSDKKSKSSNSEHKPKSNGSKASSPARSVAKEEQPQVDPGTDNEVNENREKSPSPKLDVRRSKSPVLSRRTSRGEGDESFANTLDDVPTMGTNEVADQDLASHYIDDQLQVPDIPVVQYREPAAPAEECVEEPQTILLEAPPAAVAVEAEETQIKEDIELQPEPEVNPPDIQIAAAEPVYEPSYETVEDPTKPVVHKEEDAKEEPAAPAEPEEPKESEEPEVPVASHEEVEEGDYQEVVPKEPPVAEKIEEAAIDEVQQVVKALQNNLPLDTRVEMARSASSGSSMGFNSPHERQYTPLSFSSSDAQFYSPPDSPDLSLSEQLQDNPQNDQTQVNTKHSLVLLPHLHYSATRLPNTHIRC